jgi:hypothetical protein
MSTDDLGDVPWIEKPGRLDEITAALDTLAHPNHAGMRRRH